MDNLKETLKSFLPNGSSGFLKFDKNDMKHLAIEAGLTGAIGALTVFMTYGTEHDIGTGGPLLMWLITIVISYCKKRLTDNT